MEANLYGPWHSYFEFSCFLQCKNCLSKVSLWF
uniref:AT-rich interaction domain 4A n=1 Tax=Molossus molossus TaxID=27622 RepID=A0A7J8JQB2_MOLMO|nr:AT-rich interaction domain 4A [Molossus molossus]